MSRGLLRFVVVWTQNRMRSCRRVDSEKDAVMSSCGLLFHRRAFTVETRGFIAHLRWKSGANIICPASDLLKDHDHCSLAGAPRIRLVNLLQLSTRSKNIHWRFFIADNIQNFVFYEQTPS